jgi:hypothetical protein
LNVVWTNGTTLSGIWLSGSWLNVDTDGESVVVDPAAVVVPVPVCDKAESSKDANCDAVEFEDESIDESEVPAEPRFDNPRPERSDASVVVVAPEFVEDDVVLVVPVVAFEKLSGPLLLATIDRFRVPLFAAEKTGVRVIVVGAVVGDPIEKDDVVPVVPLVKVGIVPAVVIGVTLIAVGTVRVVDEESVSDPPSPDPAETPAVPSRPVRPVPVRLVAPVLVAPTGVPVAPWDWPLWRLTETVWPPLALTFVAAGRCAVLASFIR